MRAALRSLLILLLAAAGPPVPGQDRPAEPQLRAPGAAGSQPQSGDFDKPMPVPAVPAIEASPLDTYYLRDASGNLVPVLGMSFEQFEQLLRQKKGLAPLPGPGYSLDALSITGGIEGQIANLQVTATIRVQQEGWVRVPLNLSSAVLRGSPKYEGPGEHFVTFDESRGGFVCHLKGHGERPHVVTMTMAAAVKRSGQEYRLSLPLARATESSLRLAMGQPAASASLVRGTGILSTRSTGDGGGEISVLGPVGEIELAWQEGSPRKAAPQLDASGDIRVRVESQHRITSDAALQIRSASGPLEAFRVRLPPRMELVPAISPGYSVTPVWPQTDGETGAGSAPAGQLVEVRLEQPVMTSLVRIQAALQAADAAASGLAPARFEVLGAVRQRGTIDFLVEGQWQLLWTEDATVRRIDPPDDASPRPEARFEYFRQPCNLGLRVTAQPTRVSLEPAYRMDIEAGRARLEGTLKYRFRGARASGLTFEMGDWKFERLAPDDLLDTPLMKAEPGGRVHVPFRPTAAVPSELELKLQAHRMVPPEGERLEFFLPRPAADVIAPATIVVVPADNVELTLLAGDLTGLSLDPGGPRVEGRQQPALVLRDLGGGEPASFTAAVKIRRRAIKAAATALVRLERQQFHVEQRLDYQIAYEPQRTFRATVPKTLLVAGGVQVWLDGEVLPVEIVRDTAGNDGELATMEFSAPSDRIGLCQFVVKYTLPMPPQDSERPVELAVPLVVPAESENFEFTGQQIEFAVTDGARMEPDFLLMDELPEPLDVPGAMPAFRWSHPVVVSHWTWHPSSRARNRAIAVSKAWVQTWLSPHQRQERAVFRLSSGQDDVLVRLPPGAERDSLLAAVDGQEVVVRADRSENIARITLPPAAKARECTLELWYSLGQPGRRAWLRTEQLQAAAIEGDARPRRLYWQLLLPADEFLLWEPDELSAEMTRPAGRWLLTRQPLLDQRQLEQWIGASSQDLPPPATNVYLFGTLGQMPRLEVASVRRQLLVPLASGAALAIGLLLVHVPRVRSASFLLVAGVLLAGLVLTSPHLALLLGQWSLLGLAVALVAAVWASLAPGLPSGGAASSAVRRLPADTRSTKSPSSRLKSGPAVTTTAAAAGAAAEVHS